MKNKKILFYTPNIALWVHTVPEYYLAKGLENLGNTVSYLSCGRAQSYCASMTAAELLPACTKEQSSSICDSCVSRATVLGQKNGLPMNMLYKYVFEADKVQCANLVKSALESQFLDTEILGVNIGRIALYELILMHKKMSLELDATQWRDYGVYLYNALIALIAFSRHFDSTNPDYVVAFSPQYSNIGPGMQYAINKGVKTFFIESGTNISDRLGTMRIWDWGKHRLVNPATKDWPGVQNYSVTKVSAKKVTDHYIKLLKGQHFSIYSSSNFRDHNLRAKWNIGSQQKVLLATLSSYDEAYAAYVVGGFPADKVFSGIFRTQGDWIENLIEWVKNYPEYFLIIRVHPRDFPNKRDQMQSEQALLLAQKLLNLPSNIYVNWPSEEVSIYQIFGITDVVLTGWSVTAIEALILGIPVVVYDAKLPSYPKDIVFSGVSASEYFDCIVMAAKIGWSFENVIFGFRWASFTFSQTVVDVSKKISRMEFPPDSILEKIISAAKKILPTKLIWGGDIFFWRRGLNAAQIFEAMMDKNYSSVSEYRILEVASLKHGDDAEIIFVEFQKILRKLNSLLGKSITESNVLNKAKKFIEENNGRYKA
jgi:hypothetical protein